MKRALAVLALIALTSCAPPHAKPSPPVHRSASYMACRSIFDTLDAWKANRASGEEVTASIDNAVRIGHDATEADHGDDEAYAVWQAALVLQRGGSTGRQAAIDVLVKVCGPGRR